MSSRRLGIRELRIHLSRTIREVEHGETVEVTRDGEPVARIVPLARQTGLDRLIAEGGATPARRPFDLELPLPRADGAMSASEALDLLRDE